MMADSLNRVMVLLLLCPPLTLASPRISVENNVSDEGRYRPMDVVPPRLTDRFFADEGLDRVRHLDLSNLDLTVIERGAFCGLDSVTTIDLSSNKLQSIHPNAFECNPELRKVDLSKNSRLSLGSNAVLLKSSSIVYLDLSSCNFTHITREAFKHLSNLKWISFLGNRVCAELEETMLERFPGLTYFPCGNNTATTDDAEVRSDTREDMVPEPSMEAKPSTPIESPGGRAMEHTSPGGLGHETTESSSITDSVAKLSTFTGSRGGRATEHTSLGGLEHETTESSSITDSVTEPSTHIESPGGLGRELTSVESLGEKATQSGSTQDSAPCHCPQQNQSFVQQECGDREVLVICIYVLSFALVFVLLLSFVYLYMCLLHPRSRDHGCDGSCRRDDMTLNSLSRLL